MTRTTIKGIVIHHSAIRSSNTDDGTVLFDMSTDVNHLRHRGIYSRAEYGYIVAKNGRVIQCVPITEITGHCGNDYYNENYVGISCDGYYDGYDAQKMPKTQMDALVNLIVSIAKKYDIPFTNIIPHRNVMSTVCPGDKFPWAQLMQRLIKELARQMVFTIGSTAVEVRHKKDIKGLTVYVPSPPFLSSNLAWMRYKSFAYLGFPNIPNSLANRNGNVKLRDFAKYSGLFCMEWNGENKTITVTRFLTLMEQKSYMEKKGIKHE